MVLRILVDFCEAIGARKNANPTPYCIFMSGVATHWKVGEERAGASLVFIGRLQTYEPV